MQCNVAVDSGLLGFICELFVIRVDLLMSSKTFTRTEHINVSNHSESEGEGWYTVKLT